jgi:predicted dehydrogenase
MAGDEIRVGIVGTGFWTRDRFLPAFRRISGARVVALAGRDPGRLNGLADQYEVPLRFTDQRDLVCAGEVEAVVVATPNHLHYPIVLEAARTGKHVLCEKPIALDYGQAAEMACAASAAGVVHMSAFTFRFWPAFARAAELMRQGYVGRPQHARAYFGWDWITPSGTLVWQQVRRLAGVGISADLGGHTIDQLRWWLGEFRRVSGHLGMYVAEMAGSLAETDTREPENDDVCSFIGETEGGASVAVQVSRVAGAPTEQVIEVHGSEGMLRCTYLGLNFPNDLSTELIGHRRERPRHFEVLHRDTPRDSEAVLDIFKDLPGEFVAAIREGRAASPDLVEGARGQAVIDAVVRSHEQQRWLEVEYPGLPTPR